MYMYMFVHMTEQIDRYTCISVYIYMYIHICKRNKLTNKHRNR